MNLEWTTSKENMNHAYRMGLLKNPVRSVAQYDKKGLLIRTYKSITEAESTNNIAHGNIGKACRGKCTIIHGYRWSYAE